MDQEIQQLERILKLDPSDQETMMLLVNAKERIGACKAQIFYCIQRDDGQFLASNDNYDYDYGPYEDASYSNSPTFSFVVSEHYKFKFENRDDAIDALISRTRKQKKFIYKIITHVERVTIIDSCIINFEEEKIKQELNQIKINKEKLAKELEKLNQYEKNLVSKKPATRETEFNRGLSLDNH